MSSPQARILKTFHLKILLEFVTSFSCFFRNFRAKQIIVLLIKGEKFQCPECEYAATQKGGGGGVESSFSEKLLSSKQAFQHKATVHADKEELYSYETQRLFEPMRFLWIKGILELLGGKTSRYYTRRHACD